MSTEEPLARLARYESLFELCSEINAASEIARVGESMARRLKYVADVFSWRYLSIMSERIGSLSNEGNVLIIDGYRGTTTVSNGLLDQLSSLETRMCAKRKTCFVDGEMLAEMKEALPQQFQKNDIVQLFIYPHFETGELQGLSIFSRRRQAFSELDIKFITLAVQFFHEKVYTLWEQRRLREDNMLLLEETKRARAAAEAANQAKSDFLASVSHELRTPLTSVLGFAKISKQSLENKLFPKIRADDRRTQRDIRFVSENMEIIVTEGQRLTTLINNVLDLAKIEAGKVDWNMQPLAIAEVIERATAATAALFKQKGLQLLKDMPPDLPEIVGDQDKLIQVVINLISNAVKFTPVGSVTCRAEVSSSGVGGMPEREIIVSVIDTGTGIAPEDQPKVFEKFKQVGNTLTDKPQGTGLGLPICKEIVEHHGGRIWVESEVDQGSVFSFALPVQWAETELEVTTQPVELTTLVKQLKEHMVTTAPNGTNRPKTILVVDDEEPIRKLLKQELDEAGTRLKKRPMVKRPCSRFAATSRI
jgi:signal transduction histidine kinase